MKRDGTDGPAIELEKSYDYTIGRQKDPTLSHFPAAFADVPATLLTVQEPGLRYPNQPLDRVQHPCPHRVPRGRQGNSDPPVNVFSAT